MEQVPFNFCHDALGLCPTIKDLKNSQVLPAIWRAGLKPYLELKIYKLTISPDHQEGFHCRFSPETTYNDIMQKDSRYIRFNELILYDVPPCMRRAKNIDLKDLKKLLSFVCNRMTDPAELTILRGNQGVLKVFDEVLKLVTDIPQIKNFNFHSFNADVKNLLIRKLQSSQKLKSVNLDKVPNSMFDDFQSANTILAERLFHCRWENLKLGFSMIDQITENWRESQGKQTFEILGVLDNSKETTAEEIKTILPNTIVMFFLRVALSFLKLFSRLREK
ncbi:hypothetical protein L596_030731 [Steinernema carpocapsae]|uniref:Uncharacterized protein n=1 Tax=Steinernema carpocapsae TaxID=34508 RepID=A0A4U5LNN3_STECR|nr:hypothetical protein L596_030731 [Steinernema carpocapsae]